MRKMWSATKNVWMYFLLIFLILLTFSYAMFQGGFVSWFLFYSFLPFALYSLCVAFYPLSGFEAERFIAKSDYNAGETLTVKVKLKRRFAFPLLFLVVEDLLDTTLLLAGGKQAKKLIFPGMRKEITYQYMFSHLPRGEHSFQAVRLSTGDPIGLIEKETAVPVENKIVVYPAYSELVYRPFDNHYDQGTTASRERVQRDTSMAIGVREYQPGDRFSWINWKASAKRSDLMTKEFEQRQSHDVFIVMDCVGDQRFETIVSFTASLLRAILRKGAQAGLLTNSHERVSFPCRGGEGHLHQMFYHLAKIKDSCSVSLDRIVEGEKLIKQQNVTLMLVTGNLTKALIEKVSFFGQKKGVATIFLIKNEKESPTQQELTLKAEASARGVRVVMIHEGGFTAAFSEVSAG